MVLVALLGVGTLAAFAVVAVVFVVIAVAVAPRSNPRDSSGHEPLSLDELEDDATG